jgi:hypothetical protein
VVGLFAVVSECCGGRIKATQARALVCGGGGGGVEDVVVLGGDASGWEVKSGKREELRESEKERERDCGGIGEGVGQSSSSSRREWLECMPWYKGADDKCARREGRPGALGRGGRGALVRSEAEQSYALQKGYTDAGTTLE